MKIPKHEIIGTGFTMFTEMNGIAANLDIITILLGDREGELLHDQPSMDSICEALFSLQEHIYSLSEKWMEYTEMLEHVAGKPDRAAGDHAEQHERTV